MAKMRLDEALFALGQIIGHDTLIIDNANPAASVEDTLNDLLESVGFCPSDNIPEDDYAVSWDGITRIKPDGYLEQIPLYKVFREVP